jgi:hypothetical protein
VYADDRSADRARGADRLSKGFARLVLQPVAAQPRDRRQFLANPRNLVIAQRRQPSAIELDTLRVDVARDTDEAG